MSHSYPVPDHHKRCPDCGETKPYDEFPSRPTNRDVRYTYCKFCHNRRNRETVSRLYGSSRHYHLRQRYGAGADDIHRLIDAQGGWCVICRRRPATQVDHDHTTGEIRGILCLYCNAGMGALRDDPDIIASAIEYLERSNG